MMQRIRLVVGIVLILLCSHHAPAWAQSSTADFYAGKTLTIVIGLDAGGTVDTFVRSFVPYLKKHTPGAPTILVQNMPGAGGLLATNWLMERAARDGLTITYQPWDPLAQALGNQGLRARYEQFEYVGGTSDTRIDYARVDTVPGGIKTPADIMKANDTASGVAIGALNNTDISGLVAKLSMEVLGVKHKFITGYRGGNDIFLAVQRGEVHMHNTSIGSFRVRGAHMVKSGMAVGITYLAAMDKDGKYEANRYISEMPAFPELYKEVHGKWPTGPTWDALNWLVQQFGDVSFVGLAPPGTPPAALSALRRGFEAAIADGEFVELAIKTNGLPFQFVTVERSRAIFKALADVSPAVLETVRKSIGEGK